MKIITKFCKIINQINLCFEFLCVIEEQVREKIMAAARQKKRDEWEIKRINIETQ